MRRVLMIRRRCRRLGNSELEIARNRRYYCCCCHSAAAGDKQAAGGESDACFDAMLSLWTDGDEYPDLCQR